MVTSKEDRQKNKLNKNCSKFTSKGTDIVSVVTYLQFKSMQYIQRYKTEL